MSGLAYRNIAASLSIRGLSAAHKQQRLQSLHIHSNNNFTAENQILSQSIFKGYIFNSAYYYNKI